MRMDGKARCKALAVPERVYLARVAVCDYDYISILSLSLSVLLASLAWTWAMGMHSNDQQSAFESGRERCARERGPLARHAI